jgi:hypothetical protein
MDSSRVSKITDIKVIEINVGQDGRIRVHYALSDAQGITYGGGEYMAVSAASMSAAISIKGVIYKEMLNVYFIGEGGPRNSNPDIDLFREKLPIIPEKKGGQPLTETNLDARENIGEPMDYEK